MSRFCVPLSFVVWAMGCCLGLSQGVVASEKRGLDGIETKTWAQISDKNLSRLGNAALAVNPTTWQHAETENFVFHFHNAVAATQTSIEAEFYYRVIAEDLQKDRSGWQRKAHIFTFESPEEWALFQRNGGLDPWTGGLHTGNELFVLRDAKTRWKGNTLGHEIAHLVVNRFFPGQIPLWLNEGYAENVSRKAYSAYFRARGYRGTPPAPRVPVKSQLPLERLMNLQEYPELLTEVQVFYEQSDSLVRFLIATDQAKFLKFFGLLASGSTNDRALEACFLGDFTSVAKLEEAFQKDTTRDGILARKS